VQTEANQMFHVLEHPTAGNLKVLSPPVNMDADGFTPTTATATLGSETEMVLLEVGFSHAQIHELVGAQVTHLG
jgi:crotonobetainyl-CoA:carnitine CoA-transferase CaiB-like acyl-CoA transferase